MTNTDEVTMKQLDNSAIKKDDIMAFVSFAKVTSATPDKLELVDLDNHLAPMYVTGKDLIKRTHSADWYDEEVKETKTAVAELLTHSFGKPFTVCFIKQDGEERTIRGRLIRAEHLLGRSVVEDLDITQDKHRIRQVDHRTLKWLIVGGTKYIVK